MYGVIETVFAGLSCYIVADNLQTQFNKLIYLLLSGMATVYLTVRGLANIADGWDKSSFKRKFVDDKQVEDTFALFYEEIAEKVFREAKNKPNRIRAGLSASTIVVFACLYMIVY